MTSLLDVDATDQIAALNDGSTTARELLELSWGRSQKVNPRLNALVKSDIEAARARADAIDADRMAGKLVGLLGGLPMTVKDTFDVEGMEASAGLASYNGRECQDAVMVARAKAQGAVIWGKTNTPVQAGDWQTYNRLYGTTNNPWDCERVPGGSSGGSAVHLATGVTALEMGSDIAGSLRLPAAFCGVYAHKPTFELLTKVGHVPPSPGVLSQSPLSVVGPMARSARDLALLLHVMSAGATPLAPPPVDLKAIRIGLWLDDPAMILDAAVRGAVEAYAADAAEAGITLEPLASPVDAVSLLETYNMLLMARMGAAFPEAVRKKLIRQRPTAKARRRLGAGPLSQSARILAATASVRDYLIADEMRLQLKAQMAQVFTRYEVIITPVSPVEPFPHDHSPFNHRKLTCSNGLQIPYETMKTWAALAILCGLPATSVPAGFSANGLPTGVQIIGPEGGDALTLSVAHALETAIGGFVAPALDGL